MQIRLYCLALAALTGCATTGNGPPKTVPLPTPVACVTEIPARPALEAEKVWLTGDAFDRVQALKIDRRRLLQHVGTLEATLEACKK